jgi:hypothetical protein
MRSLVAMAVSGIVLVAPGLARATETIRTGGPLSSIAIGADLTCDVRHAGDQRPAFFGATACGTFVALDCDLLGLPVNCLLLGTELGDRLFGPAVPSGVRTDAAFTPVSQSPVRGAGTEADPFKIVTTVALGGSGLRITQTDSYVTGKEAYRTDVVVSNESLTAKDAVLYRAANCVVADDDEGYGSSDPVTGAVACTEPSGRIEQWRSVRPDRPGLSEAKPDEVWAQIRSRRPFPTTCRCTERVDNAAGLSWVISVAPGASATRSQVTEFAAPPAPPALGTAVNVRPVRGKVTVRAPGADGFVRLGQEAQIPVGSEVDTVDGEVALTSATDDHGHTQAANFYEGRFGVAQSATGGGLTELRLVDLGATARGARARAAAVTRKRAHLWGKGKGRFRTKGHSAAATVRGTTWLVEDRSDGTLTFVRAGVVDVSDFVRGLTVRLHAGQSYLARTCGGLQVGTVRADTLRGTNGRDTLVGRGGDDRLSGGAGDDCLYGGSGDDVIDGGRGADRINCGAGDDTVVADRADTLIGCEHVRRR